MLTDCDEEDENGNFIEFEFEDIILEKEDPYRYRHRDITEFLFGDEFGFVYDLLKPNQLTEIFDKFISPMVGTYNSLKKSYCYLYNNEITKK